MHCHKYHGGKCAIIIEKQCVKCLKHTRSSTDNAQLDTGLVYTAGGPAVPGCTILLLTHNCPPCASKTAELHAKPAGCRWRRQVLCWLSNLAVQLHSTQSMDLRLYHQYRSHSCGEPLLHELVSAPLEARCWR